MLLAAGLVATIAIGPTRADDDDDVAVAAALVPPAPLEDMRWAFTREMETSSGRVVARFDPSRPENRRWSPVSPASVEQMTDEQADLYESFLAEPHADFALVFKPAPGAEEPEEDFDLETLADARGALVRTEGDFDVFAVDPTVLGDDDMGEFADDLSAEVTLERGSGSVRALRVYADESFKPNVAARIRELDMTMQFGPLAPDGPDGMLAMQMRISGSALFQSFDETVRTVNSDFSPVAPDEVGPAIAP
jgi:hypothetical protein